MKLFLYILWLLPMSCAVLLSQQTSTSAGASTSAGVLAQQQALKSQRESFAKQRRSILQQMGQEVVTDKPFVDWDFVIPEPAKPTPTCFAIPAEDLETTIQDAAKKQNISPLLIKAVIKQESAFKPCAVSSRGAEGLMQLMPATAQELKVSDALDPGQNIQGGAAYLKQMLDRYKGDLRLALVAYNAGPTRADQPPAAKGPAYPMETQSYVAGVLAELGIAQWNEAEKAEAEKATEAGSQPQPSLATPAPIKTPSLEPAAREPSQSKAASPQHD